MPLFRTLFEVEMTNTDQNRKMSYQDTFNFILKHKILHHLCVKVLFRTQIFIRSQVHSWIHDPVGITPTRYIWKDENKF